MNIVNDVKQAVDILNNIDTYADGLNSQLSECDTKLCDLRHILEEEKLSASQCCNFVKEMKKICLERRKVKQDMELSRLFQLQSMKLNNLPNRKILLGELGKKQHHLETKYKYRIYTEEDLINLGIIRRRNYE